MGVEVKQHIEGNHWELVSKDTVPKNVKILLSVWAMRRKRKLGTGEVYKYKARLNIHGGKKEHGINYWDTYSPVVQWNSIRTMLILSVIYGWKTKQIDFIMPYPQAKIECPMFMHVPQGFRSQEGKVFLLKQNLYGQKQAGRVWNNHLSQALISKLGFIQIKFDECVFFRKGVILLMYVDDGIILGPDQSCMQQVIDDLKMHSFKVSDEGTLSE